MIKLARMVLNEIALRKMACFRSGAGLKQYLKQLNLHCDRHKAKNLAVKDARCTMTFANAARCGWPLASRLCGPHIMQTCLFHSGPIWLWRESMKCHLPSYLSVFSKIGSHHPPIQFECNPILCRTVAQSFSGQFGEIQLTSLSLLPHLTQQLLYNYHFYCRLHHSTSARPRRGLIKSPHSVRLDSLPAMANGTGLRLCILIEIGIAWAGSSSMRQLSPLISSPST